MSNNPKSGENSFVNLRMVSGVALEAPEPPHGPPRSPLDNFSYKVFFTFVDFSFAYVWVSLVRFWLYTIRAHVQASGAPFWESTG